MQTISDQVYLKIKEAIISRDEEFVQDLNEIRISELLKTSRTPVRDTLRRLVQEGLLVKNKRGYSIIRVSASDIKLMYEFRTPLEGLAAELASERATQEEVSEMKELIEQIEEASRTDPDQLAELNGKFHDVVAKSAHNEFLYEELVNIRDKLRIVRISLFTSFERKDTELKEHRRIYEAIAARDPKISKKVAIAHQNSAAQFAERKAHFIL